MGIQTKYGGLVNEILNAVMLNKVSNVEGLKNIFSNLWHSVSLLNSIFCFRNHSAEVFLTGLQYNFQRYAMIECTQ